MPQKANIPKDTVKKFSIITDSNGAIIIKKEGEWRANEKKTGNK